MVGFGFNNLLFLSSLFYFSYKIQDTWSISSSVFIPLIIIIFYSVSLFFNINFQVRVKMKVDSWAWATCFFTRKGITVSLPCIASCLFAVRTHNSCKIILGFTSWKRKLTSGGFCNFFLIWDFGFLYLRNKINGGQNNVLITTWGTVYVGLLWFMTLSDNIIPFYFASREHRRHIIQMSVRYTCQRCTSVFSSYVSC